MLPLTKSIRQADDGTDRLQTMLNPMTIDAGARRLAATLIATVGLLLSLSACAQDIREAGAWPVGVPAAAIEFRVGPPPEAVLRHLREDNRKQGFRQVPRAADADPALAADIRQAIASMPEAVRRLVTPKLIGVFTVRDLGSTASAEHVRGEDGEWRRGIVSLDIGAIDRRANTWLSWRESTAFRAEPGFSIVGQMAGPEDDSRVVAIRYILLHEFAHVASIGEAYLPAWDGPPAKTEACGLAFVCLSWADRGGHSLYDDALPDRPRIAYYQPSERQLPAAIAEGLYAGLARSDFVTLYAATSPDEDFAEAFANYVHVQMLGLPFHIEARRDGRAVATVDPCWTESRCAVKRRFIETLLMLTEG